MILKKELVEIVVTLLRNNLEFDIKKDNEKNSTTKACMNMSKTIINRLEGGGLEIDSTEEGYLYMIAYNYTPKNNVEYRRLMDLNYYMASNGTKIIYPIKTLEQLEKGFEWILNSDSCKGIAVHIKMPDLENPEIIINPKENFAKKLEYYKNTYSDDLKLKSFDKIKIVAYEAI